MKDLRLLTQEQKDFYHQNYNNEFATALAQTLGGIKKDLMLLCKDGQRFFLQKVVTEPNENDSYFCENGKKSTAIIGLSSREYTEKGYPSPIKKCLEEPTSNDDDLDQEMVAKIKDLISESFVHKKTQTFKDKNNDSYTALFYDNNDATIDFPFIVDEIKLYKNDEQIGYIKTKYFTDETLKEAKDNGEQFYASLPDFIIERFKNKATVDYIRIEENYQGKGLGQLLYLNMGQSLNAKGIDFRSSTIISGPAEKTWSSIREKMPSQYCYREPLGDEGLVVKLSLPDNLDLTQYNGLDVDAPHQSPQPNKRAQLK